ncbi:hypothetical protein [Planktotalea frisia]|uniref:hypothetical protein n=1 Tax=Planktotalea frisia TaxID=696762 RepID=UPI002356A4A6|nr:hypothetical protein [Planktotalea frisia]
MKRIVLTLMSVSFLSACNASSMNETSMQGSAPERTYQESFGLLIVTGLPSNGDLATYPSAVRATTREFIQRNENASPNFNGPTGSATYKGSFAAVVVDDDTPANIEQGFLTGDVTLNANFIESAMSGSVNGTVTEIAATLVDGGAVRTSGNLDISLGVNNKALGGQLSGDLIVDGEDIVIKATVAGTLAGEFGDEAFGSFLGTATNPDGRDRLTGVIVTRRQ